MDEHHVPVAILSVLQCLTRTYRDDPNLDTRLLGEEWQYVLEQA
jgi:hypothetical protein